MMKKYFGIIILILIIILLFLFLGKSIKEGMDDNTTSSDSTTPTTTTTDVEPAPTNTDTTTISSSPEPVPVIVPDSTNSQLTALKTALNAGYTSMINSLNQQLANNTSSSLETAPTTTTSTTQPTYSSQSVNYDNYNHYNGTSYPTIFFGPNNSIAKILITNGTETINISYVNEQTDIFYYSGTANGAINYTDSVGNIASIIKNNANNMMIKVTKNGTVVFYTENMYYPTDGIQQPVTTAGISNQYKNSFYNDTTTYTNYNNTSADNYVNKIFYGAYGNKAQFIRYNNSIYLQITYGNGNISKYYINTATGNKGSSQTYEDKYGNSATIVYTNGKPSIKVTTQDGRIIIYTYGDNSETQPNNTTTYDETNNYNNVHNTTTSLKSKYYKNNYILKTQLPELVCPRCPQPILKCENNNSSTDTSASASSSSSSQSNSTDPYGVSGYSGSYNYSDASGNSTNNNSSSNNIPEPVLADFSTFGM